MHVGWRREGRSDLRWVKRYRASGRGGMFQTHHPHTHIHTKRRSYRAGKKKKKKKKTGGREACVPTNGTFPRICADWNTMCLGMVLVSFFLFFFSHSLAAYRSVRLERSALLRSLFLSRVSLSCLIVGLLCVERGRETGGRRGEDTRVPPHAMRV